MANIPGNTEWVEKLIPELEAKKISFLVDTDEVDDELIEVFIDELKRLTDELKNGMSTGNPELIRMSAHSVKGMGGTIGLPEISVLGLEIEMAAKEDRLEDARPLIDALADWTTTLE